VFNKNKLHGCTNFWQVVLNFLRSRMFPLAAMSLILLDSDLEVETWTRNEYYEKLPLTKTKLLGQEWHLQVRASIEKNMKIALKVYGQGEIHQFLFWPAVFVFVETKSSTGTEPQTDWQTPSKHYTCFDNIAGAQVINNKSWVV